jgi:glycosyltransferase involved in cell wall biosynthesis
VIIAPRGELASGALSLHSGRKRLYIATARLLGLTRGVIWQASGDHEAEDIRRSFGERARVMTAADLPAVRSPATMQRLEKKPGRVRLLFLARISRMKNLDGAVTLLQAIKGTVQFSVYGPIEDIDYWNHCQELMLQLPPNVTVEYGGTVSPDGISDLMTQHDLLFLPTLGENFGHVILEAMASGSPVLISDRTRWRGLEAAGVGWDVPLDEPERFQDIIQRCIAMDSVAWDGLSEGARRYAAQRQRDPEAFEQNRTLFRSAYERPNASV